MADLAVGTVVIAGSSRTGLGWITEVGRIAGAAGYWIAADWDPGEAGTRPIPPRWPDTISGVATFAPAWCVRPAVVGDTVCRHPWPHGCGLHHVPAEVLSWLPAAPARPVVTVELPEVVGTDG